MNASQAGGRPEPRRIFAVVVGLHGLTHWIGFAVPWGLTTSPDFPSSTSAAWGTIELGEAGARMVGLLWLVVIPVFALAAVGLWQRRTWAVPLTAIAALASLPLCILASPAAIGGIWLDVAILGVLAAAHVPATRQWTSRAR